MLMGTMLMGTMLMGTMLMGTGIIVAAISFTAILHDNLGRHPFEAFCEVDEFRGDFVEVREFLEELPPRGNKFEVLSGGWLGGVAAYTGEEGDNT
jgi:hypothetical protein